MSNKPEVMIIDEVAAKLVEASRGISDDQLRESYLLQKGNKEFLRGLRQKWLVNIAKQLDSPEGFGAFFELMHGTPLHKEGEKWVRNMYRAHEEGKGLLQECFRESGKTTVFSKFFMAWRIGKEPLKRNAIIRINDEKAKETGKAVADIIANNPRWKMVFENIVPDERAGWGANGYNVRDTSVSDDEWARRLSIAPVGSTLVCYGYASGSIIGSRFNGMVSIDDIHDGKNTRSAAEMATIKNFYKDTLTLCMMKGVWEVWNYTPWTTNDLYAYLKTTNSYIHSRSPALYMAEEGDEGAEYWEKEDDIPLSGRWWKLAWPENWDFQRLGDKYRKTGQIEFARMMLLDLEATKGFTLKREWLHYYPYKDIHPSWPVIMGIDYASTADKIKDKERDYFALAIMRAIPGGGIVLVDGYRGHLSKGEALDITMNYWQMYPTTQKIGVESIGKGEEFYNDLNLLQDANGRIPPLMEIKHGRKSKGERFEEWLAPRFQMSRIWLSDMEHPFLNAFIDEWLLWGTPAHDDCLDSVYMAAFAAEGFMPSMAERTFDYKKKDKSFSRALGMRYDEPKEAIANDY
jgi:hypothetical protein